MGWGAPTAGPAGYKHNQSIPTYFQDLPALRQLPKLLESSLFKHWWKDTKIINERIRLTKWQGSLGLEAQVALKSWMCWRPVSSLGIWVSFSPQESGRILLGSSQTQPKKDKVPNGPRRCLISDSPLPFWPPICPEPGIPCVVRRWSTQSQWFHGGLYSAGELGNRTLMQRPTLSFLCLKPLWTTEAAHVVLSLSTLHMIKTTSDAFRLGTSYYLGWPGTPEFEINNLVSITVSQIMHGDILKSQIYCLHEIYIYLSIYHLFIHLSIISLSPIIYPLSLNLPSIIYLPIISLYSIYLISINLSVIYYLSVNYVCM